MGSDLKRSKSWHIVEKEADARERYAKSILPTLERPDEVWQTLYSNGEVRMRYIKVFRLKDGKTRGGLVLSAEDDRLGNLVFNFIPMRRLNSQREGWLVYAADRG